MKLLIITQRIDNNDAVLGFFHSWILEFAKRCEFVTVIALSVGSYDFPENVRVHSLGKESGSGKIEQLLRLWWYSLSNVGRYSNVFVHMSPVFLVSTGWLWKLFGKKTALWYVHREKNSILSSAIPFADIIYTAAKESFTIPTPKLQIVGHGVDVDAFVRPPRYKRKDKTTTIISVGRITQIKNLDVLIHSASLLKKKGRQFKYVLVGGTVTADDVLYEKELRKQIHARELDTTVIFTGPIPFSQLAPFYWESDIAVNLCPTGGIDKAVLEGMAAGVPAIVANRAFEKVLGKYKKDLFVVYRNPGDTVRAIDALATRADRTRVATALKKQVVEHWSLPQLIDRLVTFN